MCESSLHILYLKALQPFSRYNHLAYAVFPDEETVLNWCRNTITFLRETDFGTLEEILSSLDNHNTHPADGHAKLYALARPNGRISLILNMSHAVLDIYSLGVIWQTLFDELALENNEPIDWGEEVANLPRPIANVLGEAYPQSWFGWFMTIFNAIRALSNAKAVRPLRIIRDTRFLTKLLLEIDSPASTSSACRAFIGNAIYYSCIHRGRDDTFHQTLQRGENLCYLCIYRYRCSCDARTIWGCWLRASPGIRHAL